MNLSQAYNREDFLEFLDTFLPDFEKDIRPVNLSELKEIKKASSLGKSSSLDLHVFQLSYKGSSNKRVALTKAGFNIMKQYGIFQALIAYLSEDNDDWRLSLMTATPEPTQKGKISLSYSNPKRLSFFLGPNAKINTPTRFLVSKGKVADFDDLKSRFSIEVVNKEFYKEISQVFTKLVGGLLKLPSSEDRDQASLEFAVRLIGRVIFCWFLREKKSQAGLSLMPKELLSLEAVKNNDDYYHKILEPIFFEVLNKPIESRRDDFAKEPFSSVSYLNGGLFSPQDDDYYKRTNGDFQSQYHNTLVVPDSWFKEFFEILETYNFTIDENTSYDEDLSIDPEMLGRIFENLLAEINPETGESARKSTGSYYTPRVIVNYMIDESLLLYLRERTGIKEEKLGAIISFDLSDDLKNPLTASEKGKIIDALENIKIIDPACGSGAFPIGALQKIVFILQQIDPNGQLWFKKQTENANPEFRRAMEKKFSNKELDFIRKLGVIRNSIYGVDIQPIATEISRLRCFLTLVVDERIDDSLENRGIEPLPNLDFKFVTANSLISLPSQENNHSQQTEIFDDHQKIDELKQIRDEYFTAFGIEREQLKAEFNKIQKELVYELVQEHGFMSLFKAELTQKLTDWDPFTHKPSSWFDPEWMFGIKNGFDIVIANPPYMKERDNKKHFEIVNASSFGKKYHQGKMDYWYYFLHKAIDLVSNNGNICYISSRYWLNSTGAKKLIKRVRDELSFVNFLDIGKLKVFDNVAGQHMIALYIKNNKSDDFIYKKLENDLSDISKNTNTDNLFIKILKNSNLYSTNDEIQLEGANDNLDNVIRLGNICDISQGVVEAPDKISKKALEQNPDSDLSIGTGVFVLTKSELDSLQLNQSELEAIKKYVDPSDIFKFGIKGNTHKFLIYGDKEIRERIKNDEQFIHLKRHLDRFKNFITSSNRPYGLHRSREIKYFINPKIIFKNMFVENDFTYDESGYFVGFSFSSVISKDKNFNLKYILSILNSRFAFNWFYKKGKKRGAGVDIGVEKLRLFPIKIISVDEQKPFIEIVDKILAITSSNDYLSSQEKQARVNDYKKKIDQMVYKLYGLTPKEIIIVEGSK